MAASPAAARLSGVTRTFGSVVALDRLGFELAPGEIHGLLGQNGAGKTTLARIVAGLLQPDEGRVEIGGTAVRLRSAADARARGVAMVHQHFSLVGRFTGFENVVLFDRGSWTRRGLAAPGCRDRIEARAAELGLAVDLDVPAERMSVGERQRIEILKALTSETRVLLLDEPTAVLAPKEVAGLFAVLRRVARSGTGVVLVAHKLDEVLSVADRVTVLRGGRRVARGLAADFSAEELAAAMMGDLEAPGDGFRDRDAPGDELRGPAKRSREKSSDKLSIKSDGGADCAVSEDGLRAPAESPQSPYDRFSDKLSLESDESADRAVAKRSSGPSNEVAVPSSQVAAPSNAVVASLPDVVATLTDVVAGDPRAPALRGVTLAARRGEILGVAGVEGNGQRELAAVLAGVLEPLSGTAELPADLGWAPLDRAGEGLVGDFSLVENMALALHDHPSCQRGPWLDWSAIRARTRDALADLAVVATGPDAPASTLSGGNQQRLLVARELGRSGSLLVVESPTRGLDLRATRAVRRRIAQLARGGEQSRGAEQPRDVEHPAVVLISSDLEEVLEMSDRVVVMSRGRLREVPDADRTVAAIGELMLGATGD